MESNNQKIVSLADFKKSRGHLELSDIEEIMERGRCEIRDFERVASAHLKTKRKLHETEELRTDLVDINTIFLETANWLDEEPVQPGDTNKAETIEKFRKLNKELLARSEVMRKTLVDDMPRSRFYEQRWLLDPARFISLVIVAPVGIDTFIEKFITSKNHIGLIVGESTVAVGLYLTFKSHADAMVKSAYKKVKQAPATVRALAVASALEMSVRAKPLREIEPSLPKQRPGSERVVTALKR